MRAVDRVHGNVAGNVRSPTLLKERTAIALFPHRREYGRVTLENAGFVGPMEQNATIEVLHNEVQQLLVSRKFDGSTLANHFFYFLVGERPIPLWQTCSAHAQEFFQNALLGQGMAWGHAAADSGLSIEQDEVCDNGSAPLKFDGDFMGHHAAERPAEKVVRTGGIDPLNSVGVVFRHFAD